MMKKNIEEFTHQLGDALRIGQATKVALTSHAIRNVVIAGMGGSGIGASLIQSLTSSDIPVPVVVSKGYTLPYFVDRHTLFIACSYSGDTEETLSALREGVAKKAQTICITSGGEMAQWAQKNGHSILQMPAGFSSPRAMLGYSIVLLLFALYRFHLIENTFVEETMHAIEQLDAKETTIQQQAAQVAKKIKGKLPLLYSDNNTEAIAVRFQNQLNENAKHLAHVNTFPEMNHNEIVGWVFPKSIFPQLQVIYIRTAYTHERVGKRMDICRNVFEKKTAPVLDILAEGSSPLEQYYFLIHTTDWISFFLAMENNVDPEPVEVIAYLKEALKKAL